MPETRSRFARRTAWDRAPSELEQTSLAQQTGDAPLDLTSSNPTTCGFNLRPPEILDPLLHIGALSYTPSSKGLLSAREAVATYYAEHGASISPGKIILTASTSEAYSHLFRLLCDPGDEVLIAQPGYPLFNYLADLSDVQLRAYPLFYDHGWWIDRVELDRAVTPKTRAIIVVHPNNPTGHPTSAVERSHLHSLCLRHRLSLIVDEVFLDYPHPATPPIESFATAPAPNLTFVLNGLSKVAALPQMKLGWILTLGPDRDREEASARLEIIADTFLSISTPAQLAAPAWLANAPRAQKQIRDRIAQNLALLRRADFDLYEVAAGWSAILRLPAIFNTESAFATLREAGILTHPAYFYGLDDPNRVVLSLIVPLDTMQQAIDRILALQSPQVNSRLS